MSIKQIYAIIVFSFGIFSLSPSHAVLIQGPSFITPSTSIPTCEASICLGYGTDINQISDGDSSNLNGYAGVDNEVGIISLDLVGNFDLQSFTLWNDLNVQHEGVESFMLHFFDEFDVLIQSTSTLLAPVGQLNPQTYTFAATVEGVSKVDLETLTLLTSIAGSRIEIREVAFNGERSAVVPVPAAAWLFGSGLIGLVGVARRKKSLRTNFNQ